MDIASAAGKITKLEGRVKALDTDDKDIVELVLFVCETLFIGNPELRKVFMKEASLRLRFDFPENEICVEREGCVQEKLRHGLREIKRIASLLIQALICRSLRRSEYAVHSLGSQK